MAQRTDLVRIDFQANARGANAAIESIRQKCDECNAKVTQLKDQLKSGIQANLPADQIERFRQQLNGAKKDAKAFDTAYKELVKGMRTLDQGIKAFNDGTLGEMNQAFQKALYNAAKLTRTKLNPQSETYKRDKAELTALMDASQQFYARLQADSAMVIKTIKEGGKVSRQAINDELTAHRELLQVLAEDDAGYQRTIRNIAILEQHQRAMGGNYAEIRKNITDTQKVTDEMLRNMYRELEQTNREGKVTKDILRENATAMREIRAEQNRRVQNVLGGDLTKQSEGSIRSAIVSAKELIQIYGSTSKKAQELAAQIVNAEEHLKTTGVEGERAARKQAEAVKQLADKYKMMQDRMQNLSSLSAAALAETQKYWQAQLDGATKGSRAYREAEKNLKLLAAEQERLNKAQLQASANKLSRKNLATLSEQELTASIAAAKQLAASLKPTDAAYKQIIDDIVRAEEYVKQFGLEGQRSARQAADQMKVMEDRMKNVKTLSASALEETRRFWQAQMDGAQRGSAAYKQAETNLKALTAEQQRLVNEQNKTMGKQLLSRGNLTTMSEGSIRQAIEAAKQYQQTLSTTDPMYKLLTKAIVDAEEHIKKYGLEAERAARKEVEAAKKAAEERKKTDRLMSDQLRNGRALSESALKAQQQYWQRLIDDPKTAASSLRHYEAELRKVKQLQDQMVQTQGRSALAFFRGDTSNASASQIQEQAKALKAYRDSLPQKTHATTIAEIDEILKRVGVTAQKAAAETMSFKQAMQVSAQADKGQFKGTVEQLTQAKKVLEDMSAKAVKGGLAWRRMQEALQRIELELKNVGHLSKEVQAVLDQPKGKSFNALKQAVEQGRAALNNIDRTTKEGQAQFDLLAKKIKAADFEMKQLAGTAKGSASAFDKAWSRLKTYISLYMGAAVAIQKITAAFGDLMTLSDKMGEVRKTTHWTADEVGKLSENLAKLDTRTSLQDLMSISARGGQLGLKSQEEIQGFTEAANQLMVALPEMGEQAATTLMKISKATGDLQRNDNDVRETLERVGSTIIALRANSASAAPAITDFVSRVGAVGAQAGITIDQIAALGSTVDALGGRVEMSATALSRMIPAIKNNSFAVANAIGMTEKELKSKNGMEQMMAIFRALHDSVKGFDTSTEEGMNAMADSVEQALGRTTSMQDVMKQLNQQGARAGIVFGLLSQNVDELEKQLGIASEAYSKNIALANEYANMNETTAAKWEKLKNQFEEFFVGDTNQRLLGGFIDGLRIIINLLTGDGGLSVALRTILTYWAALKIGIGQAIMVNLPKAFTVLSATAGGFFSTAITGLKALTWQLGIHTMAVGRARVEWKKLDLAMKQNFIGAVIAAIGYLVYKLYDLHQAAKEAAAETGRFNQRLSDEKKALDGLFDPLKQTNLSYDERSKLISEINSKYSKYLGYMLTETSSAIQLADAHALIAKRIKEEALEKRLLEKETSIRGEHEEEMSSRYGWIVNQARKGAIGGADATAIADAIKSYIDKNLANVEDDFYFGSLRPTNESVKKLENGLNNVLERMVLDGKITRDGAENLHNVAMQYLNVAKATEVDIEKHTANLRSDLRGIQGTIKYDLTNSLSTLVGNMANTINNVVRTQQRNVPLMLQSTQNTQGGGTGLPNFFGGGQQGGWQGFAWQQNRQTTTNMQMAPKGWKTNINKKDINIVRQLVQDQEALRGALQAGGQQIDEAQRKVAESWLLTDEELKEYKTIIDRVDHRGTGGGGGGGGAYGNYNKVTSDYSKWNGNDLVARRKEMLERVKVLANGADVQAVLSEDAKFISDAVRKNIKTTEQAIEWYNTERLKIQEALHGKHLTNTGDWQDPKKVKRRVGRVVNDEMKYYMDELDAYYTERKAKIQDALNDEEISEAEARNRTLANEAEWRQRRAELQELYAKKGEKVTAEEQQAIFDILSERTGDDVSFIRQDIANTVKFIEAVGLKSKAAMDRIFGDLDKGIEQDFLRQRNAIGKHMKEITDIVNKENPYTGITEELRKNLATMEVLLADIKNEEQRTVDMEIERTMFILEQSTKGYALTWEEMMREMAKRGWEAWAKEIEADPQMQERLMHQTYKVFEKMQDAIKKEAAELKKQADIMWSNLLIPGGDGKTTIKDAFEQAVGRLGIEEGRVSRANSLIGAGVASERVADKLAIQQMKVQLAMQRYQYNLVHKIGLEKINMLRKEAEADEALGNLEDARAKRMQAQNAEMALNLATRKEQTDELKLQEEIIAKTEESEARLYKELKEWGDLFASSLQAVMEASNTGNAEYYNELAKMNLTGKGGPGAGTYIVIDNAGTEDARAHYEYLDERQALERQREIEQQNAVADAWKKLADDLNQKMSEQITDWMNAALQNASIDANTGATMANTEALYALTGALGGNGENAKDTHILNSQGLTVDESGAVLSPVEPREPEGTANGLIKPVWQMTDEERARYEENIGTLWATYRDRGIEAETEKAQALAEMPGYSPSPLSITEEDIAAIEEKEMAIANKRIEADNLYTENALNNQQKLEDGEKSTDKTMVSSAKSAYASMVAACNMYGIAYQTMSNDNLDATQKFLMFSLQAAGQVAIGMLATDMYKTTAEGELKLPGILGEAASQLGPIAGPVAFAAMTALLGGLMGMAMSKVAKAKSQIAQATGASVGAGRLSTGMLTYAEGNVNEMTDPSTLTPGRHYNVDGADGRTYRAKYMGVNAKTHITTGPEFHLVGEKGREAIIDAHTTRNIQMNDPEIWRTIQTLYNGGSMSRVRSRRGRGVRAFADGNLDDFEEIGSEMGTGDAGMGGFGGEQLAAFQSSIEKNNELLERALTDGIHAKFDVYGKGGLVDSYDTGKKNVTRHGERY